MTNHPQPAFAYQAVAAIAVGVLAAKVAERLAPLVAEHPTVDEGRKRATRAIHVLRGRPIMHRVRLEDGTVHIDDDHFRIDTVSVISGPPRVAMGDVEAILANALEEARAAIHRAPAISASTGRPYGMRS